jgi:hypothetical protein
MKDFEKKVFKGMKKDGMAKNDKECEILLQKVINLTDCIMKVLEDQEAVVVLASLTTVISDIHLQLGDSFLNKLEEVFIKLKKGKK